MGSDGVATGADAAELERFADLAEHWWDDAGRWRRCTSSTRSRLGYIRDHICARVGRSPGGRPLAELSVVDVGCGGGLLCEPLARLGATVTGIDLAPASIEAAVRHARAAALAIDYRVAAAELVAEHVQFDLVCAMEVVEHVADQEGFSTPALPWSAPAAAWFWPRSAAPFAPSRSASSPPSTSSAGCRAARIAGRVSCALEAARARCAAPACTSKT